MNNVRLVEFVPLSQSSSNVRFISLVETGTDVCHATGWPEASDSWESFLALGRCISSTVTVLVLSS